VGSGDPAGYVTVQGIEGWENFTFKVRVRLVDGSPMINGLMIEGLDESAVLDSSRARLPVGELARWGAFTQSSDLNDWFGSIAGHIERPRGGSKEFSAEVAGVFREARALGNSGQRAVAEAFGQDGAPLGPAQAERYIREARTYGELEPPAPRKERKDKK
jgi:hypothetical protein